MVSRKKSALIFHTVRNYQRELDFLYARRAALDTLIASLERYARYQAMTTVASGGTRKTAS